MSPSPESPALNHDLLNLLVEAGGGAIGITDLLQTLNLTRQDLYRDLDALRAAGYVIGRSHPFGSTGYQLLEVPDRLTVFEIERRRRTAWLGGRIRSLDTVGSTNDEAKRLAAEGAPAGTMVIAETQTAGRGRAGNRWHSPPGAGLTLSVILRPGASFPGPAALQVATAVAVAHTAMKRTGKPARIRWPNDVLMRGRKLAGILAEASDAGTEDALYVVGIGMNVRHGPDDFPAELREEATSMAIETGEAPSRLWVLSTLLVTLEEWYDRLASGDLAAIESAWRPLSLLLGRRVVLVCGGERISGSVEDLSLTEGIRIDTGEGTRWIPAEHATGVRPEGEAPPAAS